MIKKDDIVKLKGKPGKWYQFDSASDFESVYTLVTQGGEKFTEPAAHVIEICQTCHGKGHIDGHSCPTCEELLGKPAQPTCKVDLCPDCGRNLREQPHSAYCTSPPEDAAFMKFDGAKPATELLPPAALLEVSRVLGHGARKYSAENWRKCPNTRRYVGAALRHIFALMRGEWSDPETGFTHAAHAACCLLFLGELGKDRLDLSSAD